MKMLRIVAVASLVAFPIACSSTAGGGGETLNPYESGESSRSSSGQSSGSASSAGDSMSSGSSGMSPGL